jgi:hypothetical protein
MPRAHALIDHVTRISRPEARAAAAVPGPSAYVEVGFRGGRSGVLDTSHRGRVWAEVLESLRDSGEPAYVEIDPETSEITQLLQPIRYVVASVTAQREGLRVGLAISHARHFLRRDHPEFEQLRARLTAAQKAGTPMYVVESDTNDIVDVQPAPSDGANSTETKGAR